MRNGHRDIVVIGGSAGAVEAVSSVVSDLRTELPAAYFVVVHVPATPLSALPRILSRAGPVPAEHAASGDPIICGRIAVAPPDRHLILGRSAAHLSNGPREHGHRPSADALFRSAAENHGNRVIGVVLTGMLGDGATGLARIVQRGGLAIVQDPTDSIFPSMPERAVEVAAPQHVVPLREIGPLIVDAIGEPLAEPAFRIPRARRAVTIADDVAQEAGGAETAVGDDRPGKPSGYSCPDCGGVLWERDAPLESELVCRIGHLYTLESLLEAKNASLEGALWAALRSLEEHVSLLERLAEGGVASRAARERFDERAADGRRQAALIRGLLERRD